MKINPRIYHGALIFYLVAIFVASSIPGQNFPSVDFEFTDKIVHFVMYAILFFLFFYSLKNQNKSIKLQKFALEFSLLFTALYGITDELHQYFVPNRSCEFYDWIADVIGGLMVYLAIKIFSNKKSVVVILLMMLMSGCSGTDSTSKNANINVILKQTEAWLNLMPTIGEKQNLLGFLIKLDIKSDTQDSNYSIREFKIYLDDKVLENKKFEFKLFKIGDKFFMADLGQSPDEMYLEKSDLQPEEGMFSFSVYSNNKKIKSITTPKIKIQKVY